VANVIKLFTHVIYKFSQLARVFVLSKPYQANLMFWGKAGAYLGEAAFRCTALIYGNCPDLLTLGKAGKA
jgi:hypothetical protein